MAKENINKDRDNGVWGHLLTQQDNEKALDEIKKLTKPIVDAKGNPPAKSMWSTGRGCPKCKNTLAMKELNQDTGYLWVFCHTCGAEYCADDLENTSEIGDKLHRQIPDDLVLRYMAARERNLRVQGK
jgi:hypothetical protein